MESTEEYFRRETKYLYESQRTKDSKSGKAWDDLTEPMRQALITKFRESKRTWWTQEKITF
jgi:hypothetical protein